jgi:predicted transcriptional regulator of viral defense system
MVAMTSKLYRAFLKDRFLTTKEALALIPNKDTCMNTLKQLMKSKHVVKVRRGLYEIVPIEQVGSEKPAADKFLLARKVTSPYCLAYHSALEIHGVANTAFYNLVDLASPKQFRNFGYEGVNYRWIPRQDLLGTEKTIWGSVPIVVTDRERTVLDCIDRIDLAGGFEEAFKSLSSMRNVNFEKLYSYAATQRKRILLHKLGFFLSQEQIRESWRIGDEQLARIKEKLSSKIYYFLAHKGTGRLVKEWNLIVPTNVEGMMSFA